MTDVINVRHNFEARTFVELDPTEPDRDVMEATKLYGRVSPRPIVPHSLSAHWTWDPDERVWSLDTVVVNGKLRLKNGTVGVKYGSRVFGLISFNQEAPPWITQYVREMRREVEAVTP